ncbi:hypothetical protein [Winogradskyella sp.]|uniref:hypothetical protein n=1 Tax=Winogradskyella sp. TaxID=1883156 RepID=UPI003AB563FB
MNWEEALQLLTEHIVEGLHLDPEANYKIIREIPPYQCRNYNNEMGFRIQVGEKSLINVPLSMLEAVFNSSVLNENTYNRDVFAQLYPHEIRNKPCYVHSVGKLFSNARVMEQDSREYNINL